MAHSLFRKLFETWEFCVLSGKMVPMSLYEVFCHCKNIRMKVQLSPQKQNLEPYWCVEVLSLRKAGASGSW